ncbi:DUF6538 domain-containing protein [Microvirga sp. CF3016]
MRPLVGKREVKRSLKTMDFAIARERHADMVREAQGSSTAPAHP